MKIKMVNLTLLLLFAIQSTHARQLLSGYIYDTGGEPIIGATILEKNTPNGVASDIDGFFSFEVVSIPTTLFISYVGCASKEVEVTDASQPLSIILEEEAMNLNEVVVTGLGIKKEKKALGYAVSTLQSASSTNVKSKNQGRKNNKRSQKFQKELSFCQ